MEAEEQHEASAAQFRKVIDGFLKERLQPKLDKLKEGENEKRQKLLDDHQPENWIADAARRAGQIQQVTHALKYIHPDAKGTRLSSPGNSGAGALFVGTHTSANLFPPDVVGNAAALDVYKFLRLDLDGKSLLSRAASHDPVLQAALSDDAAQAESWMVSFAMLTESKGAPSSHTYAKQIYWPLEDKKRSYHLLAPLFPSSLVHYVWSTIREHRFSDEARSARDAHRNRYPYPHGYKEYPNIVVQKFGGTKPQNISQLNSERYGENQLLSSTPPNWKTGLVKPPMRVESIFDGWLERRPNVRYLIRTLRGFLYSVQDVDSNIHIRNRRKELTGAIVDELLLFAAELRDLKENWTLDEVCKLNINEQCWLDPERAKTDEEFSTIHARGDWVDAVCKRFGNWLIARMIDPKKPLPLGDDEAREWQSALDKEVNLLRMGLEYDE